MSTQSIQNFLFNFQPFKLIEILPEDAITSVSGAVGALAAGAASTKNVASTRAEPWTLSELTGSPLMIPPTPPFNDANLSATPPAPPVVPPADPSPAADAAKEKASDIVGVKPKTFQADCIVSESYSRQSVVTEYPVDDSTSISDHAFERNFSISVSAIQPRTVLSYVDTLSNITNSPLGQGIQSLGSKLGLVDPPISRMQAAFDMLVEWQRVGQPLEVHCKYAPTGFMDQGSIVPFVIENLNIPRNKDVGQALRVDITLKRIKLVKLGITVNSAFSAVGKTKGTGPKRDAPLSKAKGKLPKKPSIADCAIGVAGKVQLSTAENPCGNPNNTN